ncbi:MAG: hypothetical protein DKINENOH_01363 [bacterium]|nr:hypothetical protein [bacterium]
MSIASLCRAAAPAVTVSASNQKQRNSGFFFNGMCAM